MLTAFPRGRIFMDTTPSTLITVGLLARMVCSF